jgi:polar amino acid transport system permease protein
MYNWDFSVLAPYWPLLLQGALVTVGYTVASILFGLVIGLLVGTGLLSPYKIVRMPLRAYTEVFRCTPLLVQIIWFYYALPVLIGKEVSAATAGISALSLYAGAFYAEIFRGGIKSIEIGQWNAAAALNMTVTQTMRRIVLPQAIQRMAAPFMNQSILQLKNTSLISTIAIADIIYQGTILTSATYRPFEVYTVVAAIYFCILFPVTILVRNIEERLAR